jgi:hypothetical protein
MAWEAPVRSPAVRVLACCAILASLGAGRAAAAENLSPLLNRLSYETADGPYAWTSGSTPLSSRHPSGALRVSVGGVMAQPNPALNLKREFQARDVEVALVRDWPAAVRYDDGVVEFDVTPHAGLGFTNFGGTAEAGATVRLSRSRDERARAELARLGVGDGPAAFGERGRWYLFAAASGRAVGLNMLRDDSGWRRAGWTTDPSSTLISDAQLGVGYRRGAWQTSVGYVHREVKGDHMVFGQQTKEDSLAAFTLSFKPH